MDMPEVLISFSAAARRRYWWRTGVLMLVLVGGPVAVGVTVSAPDRWWWGAGFGAFGLLTLFDMINRIYGRAVLTAAGMEFRTFVSRRSLPWCEIAGVKVRQRGSRSGIWSDLRLVRVRGRSLTVPGTMTNRIWDAELDRKLVLIQEHWSRAVGGSDRAGRSAETKRRSR
ncbi:hypothetical protein OG372_00350 [Streptomyces sp. NBC_01020]|uniref:hypothetical protein n=1 Tax=unclassified Streptomyces TaxID=2593676 RepID=UPI002E20DDB9|nr:hypothetical protein OG372_00350 [Streptomyces sp. NBC_01020]WSX71801.1 hypothetical protein OG221_37240 [Streptomyces sp. NBC_00932]